MIILNLSSLRTLAVSCLLLAWSLAQAQNAPSIRLEVDATQAPRKIIHSRLAIPATPGPMTLCFPKWIQGEHGPTGPVADAVGLTITGNEKPIAWKRDPLDMYSLQVVVPGGVQEIVVSQDFLSPTGTSGFSGAASATDHIFTLNWNQLLLFPHGSAADQIRFTPSLRIPEGWEYASALHTESRSGSQITFVQTTLTTLIDSPVLMGDYFRTVELNGGSPKYWLHIAADSREALELKPEVKQELSNLVEELGKLFGSRPHSEYHFLLSLSDHVAHFGLEHHESTDIRFAEQSLTDGDQHNHFMWIMAHEVVHSWNGKYRRPAGLVRDDPQQPLDGELLWVYEGLTHYLGFLLSARSGLWSEEVFRDNLALIATRQDQRTGRSWRPLVDTCVAAQILYPSADSGKSWRRGVDFYEEGALIWLEADTLIRQRSAGKKSLDDFCRSFFGGQNNAPALKPYGLGDVVSGLNGIVANDWKTFLEDRIYKLNPKAPVGGIVSSGWKLSATNRVSTRLRSSDAGEKEIDLTFSIGLLLGEDGTVKDVLKNSPADEAGVVPGSKLIAVNDRKWSAALMRDAIKATTQKNRPLELLSENAEFYHRHPFRYDRGARYPALVREESREDVLSSIMKPLGKRP